MNNDSDLKEIELSEEDVLSELASVMVQIAYSINNKKDDHDRK